MPYHLFIRSAPLPSRRNGQHGVVLVVALIMLVIISLLATFSIRNATSTEAVAGNVRTTQLATQAAEIALRYCEDGLEQSFAVTPTFTITPSFILSAQNPPRAMQKIGSNLDYWDTSTSVAHNAIIVIPTSALGGSGTYSRSPECMIEAVQVLRSSNNTDVTSTFYLNTTTTFLITARGFGPEVGAASSDRKRPIGSEVWLQSTLEF